MWGTAPPLDLYKHYTSHGAARRDETSHMKSQWSEVGDGNRGCGICRSPSGVLANQAGSPVATTRSGPMKINSQLLKDRANRSGL